jgi:hypothetical protein
MTAQETLVHPVARQVLRGLRESLTIAGQVGRPVQTVNAVLHLQTACDGCIVLSRWEFGSGAVAMRYEPRR